ncbi:MAG: ABC transporter ATP-binding protein, partial [Lachnospiraceae bacterium]|nr:ABC transporter ATP-binding protein [Lachnospiraceae bacterium]
MIRIENLSVVFGETEAVKNLYLNIMDGEILGIVGESGSGKSVTALSVMGLLSAEAQVTGGTIRMGNEVLLQAGQEQDKERMRNFRGSRMSMVFQEPMTSLNPTRRVGAQVDEVLVLHTQMESSARYEKVLEAFRSVGLKDVEKVYDSYPHQLSGGMRQRVMIAMAIILKPELLIADEPTTALDVRVQNQIIEVLRDINEKQKTSMLFITHDLNLARRICDRIAVMKDGKLVELRATEDIFLRPREEYTRKLIEAVPSRVKKKAGENAVNDTVTGDNILEVRDLNVYYQEGSNSLFGQKKQRCVVEQATFSLAKGETLGLVGESGCGKTSLCKAILGMNKLVEGDVKHFSIRPQMIFQDPYSSLNPA